MAKKQAETVAKQTVEQELTLLYKLQETDSKIDEIQRLRGELPLEVKDLEDELAGLETRITKAQGDIAQKEKDIVARNEEIKDAEALIKKYEEDQRQVRNNREFDAIDKEIEFQKLTIELAQKRIKEYKADIENKKQQLEIAKTKHNERKDDLTAKETELNTIINETKAEEYHLKAQAEQITSTIEERLVVAYGRLRHNARNGLAIATVERDACGGCFNKIPPQRQLDIKSHKKIIVCEYCGRILVDKDLVKPETEKE